MNTQMYVMQPAGKCARAYLPASGAANVPTKSRRIMQHTFVLYFGSLQQENTLKSMRDMPVWDEHVAKLACPNDRVHAYLDDIVILNRPERASAACDCVTRAVATHAGVSANLGKTRVYHPAGGADSSARACGGAPR